MTTPEQHEEQHRLAQIADELDALQKEKNGGRGVSSVQTVILYIRKGDLQKAQTVCWNEADKISSYPDIRATIQRELFAGAEEKDIPPHFRSTSDELYKKE